MAKNHDKAPLPEDDDQPLNPEPIEDLDADLVEDLEIVEIDDLDAAALDDIEAAEGASQVNLGANPSGVDPSGISVIEWSDLIEDEELSADGALVVDSPEDADILQADEVAVPDSAVNLGAEPPSVPGDDLLLPPTSSAILNDPNAAMVLDDDDFVPMTLDSEAEIELGTPTHLPRLPGVTGVNKEDADLLEPEIVGEASAVDLSGEELLEPEVVESSSGIGIHDLCLEEVPAEQLAGEEVFENSGELVLEEIVQQDASGIDLGEEVPLGAESPSRRDLIAEAVESGVDLPDAAADLVVSDGDSEVRLDEQFPLADDHEDDLIRKMDELSSGDEHPALHDEMNVAETMETSSIDEPEEPADMTEVVDFDQPAGDEEILKTGGRIARPDSLGDVDWDEGVAGETPADASMFEEVIHGDPDQPPLEEPLGLQEEEAAPMPVPEKGKKGKKKDQKAAAAALEEEFTNPDEPKKPGKKEKQKQDKQDQPPGFGSVLGGVVFLALGGGIGAVRMLKPEWLPEPLYIWIGLGVALFLAFLGLVYLTRGVAGRRAAAWVGGIALGLIFGIGGTLAASLYGIDATQYVSTFAELPQDRGTKPMPVTKTPATFADVAHAMKNGDFEKATNLASTDPRSVTPEETALRGELRFKSFLQKQAAAGMPIKADDEAVKTAITDLQEAGTPDATLTLAQIQMQTGNLAAAEKILKEGAAKFKDDRRFASSLIRVQFLKDDKAAPPGGGARLDDPGAARALLVALCIGLQPAPEGQPGAEAPEAGFEFWQAMKLSREQKFPEARAALARAIQLHDKRRLQRLNKAQNPDSDPFEDIFPRACKELLASWEAQEKLKKNGYLVEKGDPRTALTAALKEAEAGKKLTATIEKAITNLQNARVIDKFDGLTDGVDKIIAGHKVALAEIKRLEGEVTAAKTMANELKTELAIVTTVAAEALDEQFNTRKQLADAKKTRDDLIATEDRMAKQMADARVIDKKADRADLARGLAELIKTADIKDHDGLLRSLTKEVAALKTKNVNEVAELKAAHILAMTEIKARNEKILQETIDKHANEIVSLKDANKKEVTSLTAQLKESRRAADVLPIYLRAIHERGTGLDGDAFADVRRVDHDPLATATEKGNAEVIRALALRNGGKYAEAKIALEAALPGLKKDSPFFAEGTQLLAEASDPAFFVSREVENLQSRGRGEQALKLLRDSMGSLPAAARPSLLAQRALVQLDELSRRTNGRFRLEDVALIDAQSDAAAAEAAGIAEGSYAAGRIAEELGQFNVAIEKYREAIRRHGKLDGVGARYRIALSRSLIQASQPWTPPGGVRGKPLEGKMGKADLRVVPGLREMLILMTLGFQPGELLGSPNRAEALRLADEILAQGNKVPFDVRAQALAIKGHWTEGLVLFAEGLRGHLRGDLADGLLLLIRNHPALKKDDVDRVNPVEADRLYAQGVRLYFQRDYAEAEKLFLLALENYDQDARTFYFLGLARLAQGNRDQAYASFEMGAQLERGGKPGKAAINSALERVQGTERRLLGQIRDRVER